MKHNKKLLALLLIALLGVQFVYSEGSESEDEDDEEVARGTFCQPDKAFNGRYVHTEIGEKHYIDLRDYIKGYNLEFEMDPPQPPNRQNTYSIGKNLAQAGYQVIPDHYKFQIDHDRLFLEDGDSKSSQILLSKSMAGEYVLRFASGQNTQPPMFNDDYVKIPKDDSVTCYGAKLIKSDLGLVDCVKFIGSTQNHFRNVYYIVRQNHDPHLPLQHITLGNVYLHSKPFERKTIRYDTSHNGIFQLYLIQGVPFDMANKIDGDYSYSSYLNIYRYVTNEIDRDNYHNGHLVQHLPITADTLSSEENPMPFDNLVIADFDALNDWIYILDKYNGVVFFKYVTNTPTLVNVHLFKINKPTLRFGIHAQRLGSQVELLIVESTVIKEYLIDFMPETAKQLKEFDKTFQFQKYYEIEDPNTSVVEVQSNQQYIALQQGKLVTIYDRTEKSSNFIKAQIKFVDLISLWYTNNIYIIKPDEIFDYLIQDPYLVIRATKDQDDFPIAIKAVSRKWEHHSECSLGIVSIIVEKDSQNMYYTGVDDPIEWMYQRNFRTSIKLGNHFVGPNIFYTQAIKSDDLLSTKISNKNFLGRFSNEAEATMDRDFILIDEPQEIEVELYDQQKGAWKFTEIIPIPGASNDQFYSVHQATDNKVEIYFCQPNQIDIDKVDCAAPIAEIPLPGKIITIDYGTWGYEKDVLAIVNDAAANFVEFYHMSDTDEHDIGELWYGTPMRDPKVGPVPTVIDIELQDNVLYSVVEGSLGGVQNRIVLISEFRDELIAHQNMIDQEQYDSWPHKKTKNTWLPQEVRTNTKHKNVIFILTQLEIFVVSIQNHQARFINHLPHNKPLGTHIGVTNHALLVANSEGIKDYSIINLNSIQSRVEETYPQFGYKFIDPLQVAYGKTSGLVYVLAQKNGNGLSLMVYRSGAEKLRTLVKIIDIEYENNYTIDFNKPLDLSAGGDKVDFIFLEYNDKKRYFRAPRDDHIVVYPIHDMHSTYVNVVDIDIEAMPMQGTPREITHSVSLVNSQMNIKTNDEAIQKAVPQNLYADDKDHAVFETNIRDWYYGNVLTMDIQCHPDPDACGDKIKLTNVVEKENTNHKLDDIADVEYMFNDIRGKRIYVLHSTEEGDYEIRTYQNDLTHDERPYNVIPNPEGDFDCEQIVPAYDNRNRLEFVFTFCYDVSEERYIGFKVPKQAADGEEEIPIERAYFYRIPRYSVKQGQIQIFHDAAYINVQDLNGQQSGIYIYDLTSQRPLSRFAANILTWDFQRIINEYAFSDGFARGFRATSFFVTYETLDQNALKEEHQYVKLFITNSPLQDEYKPQLWFLDLDIAERYQIDEDMIYNMDYDQFVLSHNLFVNQFTHLLKMELIQESMRSFSDQGQVKERMVYDFILLTSNTALYEIRLVFYSADGSVFEPMEIAYNECTITNVYNNFGDRLPVPHIAQLDNAVSVTFLDKMDVVGEQFASVVFYELRTPPAHNDGNNTRRILDQQTPELHTMQGGWQFLMDESMVGEDFMPYNSQILYRDANNDNKPSLLTTDYSFDNKLSALQYNAETIKVETFGSFEKQRVTFMFGQGVGGQDQLGLNAEISPGKFKPDGPDPINPGGGSNNTWWIVLLSVLGGILIIGGIGFFLWKKKQSSQDSFMRQPLNSKPESVFNEGMSLQEKNTPTPTKA